MDAPDRNDAEREPSESDTAVTTDDYEGPDPEADEHGDEADEDQGT